MLRFPLFELKVGDELENELKVSIRLWISFEFAADLHRSLRSEVAQSEVGQHAEVNDGYGDGCGHRDLRGCGIKMLQMLDRSSEVRW